MIWKPLFVIILSFISHALSAMDVQHPNVTVHLMWVNKEKKAHIVPNIIVRGYNKNESHSSTGNADFDKYLQDLKSQVEPQVINSIERIVQWAQYYPVTVWYDSHAVDNVEQTLQAFQAEVQKAKPQHSVVYADVRTLKTVQECPDIFDEKVPLYFRVDLLRPIIGLERLYDYIPVKEVLSKPEPGRLKHFNVPEYLVYADWSVKPMDPKTLLDSETQEKLHKFGMVMSLKAGSSRVDNFVAGNFENNFFILASNNPTLYYCSYYALIKLNIERYRTGQKMDLEHAIYSSYRGLFALYHHLTGEGTMTYDAKTDVVPKTLSPALFAFLNRDLLKCFGTTTFMPNDTHCGFVGKWKHYPVPVTDKPGHFMASQFG